MSVLTFDKSSSDFARLKTAFARAEREAVEEREAVDVSHLLHQDLDAFHVHYKDGGNAFQFHCRNICVLPLGWNSGRAVQIARFCRAFATYFVWEQDTKIVCALLDVPKKLVHSRPMIMDDINSGVTYRNQNTIILWRGGHDFGKVLIHEMIHLMANDTDEADTEAHALDLHCMTLANTYDEYLSIKEKQIQKSLALAEKMRGVDAGTTKWV